MILLVWFFCIMQWLAIWAGVAKIKKVDKIERKKLFWKLFCTMGFPAIVAFIVAWFIGFTSYSWVALVLLVVLDIVFLCCGEKIYRKLFAHRFKAATPSKSTYHKNKKKKKR